MNNEVCRENLLGKYKGYYYYSNGAFVGTSNTDRRGRMCPAVTRDSFARIHDRLWQSDTHIGRFMAIKLCRKTYGPFGRRLSERSE